MDLEVLLLDIVKTPGKGLYMLRLLIRQAETAS